MRFVIGGNNGGEWSICHGNSQTFLSADGWGAASTAQRTLPFIPFVLSRASLIININLAFTGVLGSDVNVNVMSAAVCSNASCPWFYRQVAMEGWAGDNCGSKLFAIKVPFFHHHQNVRDMISTFLF